MGEKRTEQPSGRFNQVERPTYDQKFPPTDISLHFLARVCALTRSKHYLLASDFDQTLSFNDSGFALREWLRIPGFEKRSQVFHDCAARREFTYLIRHDREYRRVRQTRDAIRVRIPTVAVQECPPLG
jgi:hypothetical protein